MGGWLRARVIHLAGRDLTPMSRAAFRGTWWLPGGHGQTIWPLLAGRVRLDARCERLDLPDGDFVRLDWVGRAGPIVVILPGLQGDMKSSYVRRLLRQCERRGWRGVLLNYRGRGEPNRFPHSYHCGMTSDLHYLVHHLRQREPHTPIATVGYSVGANICLKWLGESGQRGDSLPVVAAVGVSAPFHLGVVAGRIGRGLSRVYQWYLLRSLRRDILRKLQLMDLGLPLDRGALRRIRTFSVFDRCVSAPLNGFKDAEDYYARTRTDVLLRHVNVPTLLLHARNDPLVPTHVIPEPGEMSDKVTLELMRSGGHMGFIGGRWPWAPRFWLDQRVPEYLAGFFTSAASIAPS